MPASVIPVTGLLNGPVGAVSQTDFPLTTPRPMKATATIAANFGDLLVLDPTNTYLTLAEFIKNGGTLTANTPLGVAQQNVKTNTVYPTQGTAFASITQSGNYPPSSIADALTRGTINVFVNNNNGSQFAGQGVFVRVKANAAIPAGIVGGIEAVADGANTVQVTNLVFKTGVMSVDPVTSLVTAQVTLLTRTMA